MSGNTKSNVDLLKTIIKKIMIEEKKNLKTKVYDDAKMIKRIKQIIEGELS